MGYGRGGISKAPIFEIGEKFPCLQQLVLHRCRHLSGIPYDVAEITSLEMIEVKWCHRSAASSAQEISKEGRGIEGLHLSFRLGQHICCGRKLTRWCNNVCFQGFISILMIVIIGNCVCIDLGKSTVI